MTAKERPILFSAPMVRAILEGRKTQSRRRVMRGAQEALLREGLTKCPYGAPGDRLWVRETTHRRPMLNLLTGEPLAPKYDGGAYSADDEDVLTSEGFDISWWYSRKVCPAIHMPRWASRIDLEVTGVRVERLQDISEADALAEGVERLGDRFKGYLPLHTGEKYDPATAKTSFSQLWESINGDRSWDANPFVWVIEFKRIKL